jgi:phage protein D
MGSVAVFPQDVYVGQDFYVPAFRVKVRGQDLRQIEYDVLGVTYTDSNKDIDSFDLTVNNWDPDGKGPSGSGQGWFKYSDTDILDPWQDVELFMGYYRNGNDELRRMLVGEITRMTPNFPASGASTMTIHCVNLLQRFRTIQITKDYFQKKDSWIARDLIGGIADDTRKKIPNLVLSTDSNEIDKNLANENEVKHLTIKQEYAINFLLERSRQIGYEISLEEVPQGDQRNVTFHYRPSQDVIRPTYKLEWGKSLISFQPSFGTAKQVNKVIVRSWNPDLKKKFEGTATRADLLSEGVLDPTQDFKVRQGPLADNTEIVTDEVVQSDDEAKLLAKKRLRMIAQGLVTGKGKTVGLPDLRTGGKIQIIGLGRYDGMYVVETTTHSMGDSGYTTDFSARMEKEP